MAAALSANEPNLAALLQGIAAAPPREIAGITSDSRSVAAGDAFLACRGERSHGLDYVGEALRRKASAVVWDDDGAPAFSAPADVVSIPVRGLAGHLGQIANRWFDTPSATVRVAGVTGTNGKTTVAFLIARCLQLAGRPSAYLGTLGAGLDELDSRGGLTTPDCIEVHRRIAAFRDAGARHAAMEVSSHGLLQRRVDGVTFDAAVFTNLSRDHIDYHGSMAAYGDSKARLFLEHHPVTRVICLDSDFGVELANRCGDDVVVVASRAGHDRGRRRYLFVTSTVASPDGATLEIDSTWGRGRCRLPLYGAFNIANAAEVLALLLCYDIELRDALEMIAAVKAPPGRMQRVTVDDSAARPQIFVDYAHTPAALEAALSALRAHCNGRLWCVFGCGGDRDRGKRPLMGEVVERIADRVVITNDNPRSENPLDIFREIQSGMHRRAVVIEDRAAAIAWAVAGAADDDLVLIAGKGHEDYQIIGERRIDFSDDRAAQACLRARLARRQRR